MLLILIQMHKLLAQLHDERPLGLHLHLLSTNWAAMYIYLAEINTGCAAVFLYVEDRTGIPGLPGFCWFAFVL